MVFTSAAELCCSNVHLGDPMHLESCKHLRAVLLLSDRTWALIHFYESDNWDCDGFFPIVPEQGKNPKASIDSKLLIKSLINFIVQSNKITFNSPNFFI